MRRIKLTVAYDGTNYCGWQAQSNGVTIEGVLNEKLSMLTGEKIRVTGASRTDSGVHALGNMAVFDTESPIPPERFVYALNKRLPEDIVAVKSEEVPLLWHPRHCDCVKIYDYHVLNSSLPNPVRRLYTYHVSFKLDIDKMRMAASFLIGEHDFASFCAAGSASKNTVRTVYSLNVEKREEEIIFRITGNGFLYHMVRIIVGTLLLVGRGCYEPQAVKEILKASDRKVAGVTVPPQGLVLVEVRYP